MALHTKQEEKVYSELVALYDYAEKLLSIVEENASDVDADLAVVEPLIAQLIDSADTFTDIYRQFVESRQHPSPEQKEQIERALERMCAAMAACKKQLHNF